MRLIKQTTFIKKINMKSALIIRLIRTMLKLLYLCYTIVVVIWASFEEAINDDGVLALNCIELSLLIIISLLFCYHIQSNFKSITFTTPKLLNIIATIVCLVISICQLLGPNIRHRHGIKGIFFVFKLTLTDIALYDMLVPIRNNQRSPSSIEDSSPLNSEKIAEIMSKAMKMASNTNDKELMNEIDLYLRSTCRHSYEIIDQEEKIDDKKDEAISLIGWNFSLKLDETARPIDPQDIIPEPSIHTGSQDLEELEKIEFDIFKFSEENGQNSLQIIMNHLFNKFDFFNTLNIPQQQFKKLILRIQSGYKAENPYHNSTHAADVVQAFHYMINSCGAKEICNFSPAEVAICYISAAIHDYQHPGLTNAFLVNTQHKLAMLYNDKAVLENFHISSAFNLTMKPSMNIFINMEENLQKLFRKKIIDLVLATDMSKHFEHLNNFQGLIDSGKVFSEEGKYASMELLMHFCDLSNAFRPFEISKKWTELINQEFFMQGDKEKELGIPISPTCNRDNVIVEKAQLNFVTYLIEPFISPMETLLPKFKDLVEILNENKEELERILAESNENQSVK
ncbi:PDE4C [Blepharisma stoltei]|uniref:Phosphodiesterase n=1 Tax=Blepharisma stoltei TaxID=1481888 RepID=A0AAU9I8I8_9CILI|nr:unnamed protein product [Blepharisma stoltei]